LRKLYLSLFVLFISSLSGCRWVDDAISEVTRDATKAQVEESTKGLTQKLSSAVTLADEQSASIAALRKELDDLKKVVKWNDYFREAGEDKFKTEWASLSSDNEGYSIARTTLGPAVVKLNSITPYLDGFKLKLWIAFLVPIQVNGIKGKVSWQESDAEVLKKDKRTYREKEFDSAADFPSGRYKEIEVVLSPASAAGLKTFSVSLQANQILVGLPYAPK